MSPFQIVTLPNTLNSALETWFIQNNLLGGVPYSAGSNAQNIHNSVVVYLALCEIQTEIIQKLKSNGNKVVLFHMGDEWAKIDISGYQYCDLVVRNYFFEKIIEPINSYPKIFWAPNGFRTGVGPREMTYLKKSERRHSLASFMGWIKNSVSFNGERNSFAQVVPNCGENLFAMGSDGFASGYNIGLYSAILEDSVFAPCPAGNSPETIRLYDALEVGAIPISLEHSFLKSKNALGALGPVPFPILGSWEELPSYLLKMKEVLSSQPDEIDRLQMECINWWARYKQFISAHILGNINQI